MSLTDDPFLYMIIYRTGSIPNLNNLVEIQPTVTPSEPRQSFVDKIHGITDKLQSLGHIGHDNSSDAKGKSGETLTVINL